MTENNATSAARGTLYLIPVPLSDTTRPVDVLPAPVLERVRRLRYFAVENIRSARRFLKAVDRDIVIDNLTFEILDEHTDPLSVPSLLAPLQAGNDMGCLSEAGCPGVADPGALLVDAARHAGINVRPYVGPSSILLGLMASGFNGQQFAFSGYLPIESGKRSQRLKEMVRRIRTEGQTQIFIETPYRNNRLIEELARELPSELRLCVASDLTSQSENVTVASLREWARRSYDYSKHPTIFLLYR